MTNDIGIPPRLNDVRRTYKLLRHSKITEIRLIESNSEKSEIISKFVKNEEDFVKVCCEFSGSKFNVYVGINERTVNGTKDGDVVTVKTTCLDIDSIRAKNVSSTKEQIKEAKKIAKKICADIVSRGFKKPSLAFSGNCFQIWIQLKPIDITDENREEIKLKLKAFEKEIRDKFETKDVRVDSVHNPSRIMKVIGVLSVKGEIHRLSKWIHYSEDGNDEKLTDYILSLPTEKVELPKNNIIIDNEYIKKIIDSDPKIKQLYNGNIEGYKSRSEAEEALVCKLVIKGITDYAVIDTIMCLCKIGKWKNSKPAYREITYRKAIEFCAKSQSNNQTESKEETQTKALLRLIEDNCILFHDQFNDAHAKIKVKNHFEIVSLKSKFFNRWATLLYLNEFNEVPNSNAITAAINAAAAKAYFLNEKFILNNRVAYKDDSIYYDLTNTEWGIVKINKDGWEIVNEPPILFKRFTHQKAQLYPSKNYTGLEALDKIFDFINLKNEGDKQLIKVYIISCFIPDIPHVILILYGSHGSSKSTVFKVLNRIIDPSILESLSLPNDNKELIQKLSHHWCAYFDNASYLKQWQSDALCRASTGEGFSKRELYSDDDDIIYTYKRCVGLNGITNPATKPDLLDRSLLFKLERITAQEIKTEDIIWDELDKLLPDLLGAVFTTLSKAMEIKQSIQLQGLPRMADFAVWGESISRALGYEENSFIRNYYNNIGVQNLEAIEGHTIGSIIMELIAKEQSWEGTATELLSWVREIAEQLKIDTNVKSFPKAPNSLTNRLGEIKSNLEDFGIKIYFSRKGGTGTRLIKIVKEPSLSSQPSQLPSICDDGDDGFTRIRANEEIVKDDEIKTPQGRFKKTVANVLLPCKTCGKMPDKGCQYEDVVTGAPYCNICAGIQE